MQAAVIVGAGGVGSVLAAALTRAGYAVTVLGGRPVGTITLVEGDDQYRAEVEHLERWDSRAAPELLIVAVKAHHIAGTAEHLRAAAGPGTTVVVAQNGVEHEARVAPFANGRPIVPVVLYFPAERTEIGRVLLTRPAGPDLAVPDDAPSRAVARALEAGGLRVAVEADFRTTAWSKLLMNLASMTVTTLTGRRQEVIRDPAVAAFAVALLSENLPVARAEGASVDGDEPGRLVAWLQGLPDGSTTSMLQDRLAGRELEVDAIHGAAVRAADRHGIEIPLTRAALALLGALRAG